LPDGKAVDTAYLRSADEFLVTHNANIFFHVTHSIYRPEVVSGTVAFLLWTCQEYTALIRRYAASRWNTHYYVRTSVKENPEDEAPFTFPTKVEVFQQPSYPWMSYLERKGVKTLLRQIVNDYDSMVLP
jgi:hypothetical protein